MNTLIILAIALGALFGFALDRVGATNPQNIIQMLRLKDLHLMRTILFAIAVSSALVFGGMLLGLFDPTHLSVKSAYIGVIIGGGILGLGFAIAGYCPGTGITALATGRKDALWFVLGGLLGAFVYMQTYAFIKNTWLMDKIAGGKATLGTLSETDFVSLSTLSGEWLGLGVAIILAFIAWKLPKNIT